MKLLCHLAAKSGMIMANFNAVLGPTFWGVTKSNYIAFKKQANAREGRGGSWGGLSQSQMNL
jgi:hypothetical protein